MKRLALIAAAWIAVAAASGGCAEDASQSDDDDGSTSSGVTSSSGAGAGSSSSGQGGGSGGSTSSSGSGGSAPAIPICLPACTTPADCNLGAPHLDEDNYSCDQGACIYQGCNGNSECQTLGNYVCYQPAVGASYCTPGCTAPADCNLGGGVAYDADNYTCEQGGCVYAGCNSDSECQSLGNYVCRDIGGTDYCQIPCNSPIDCVLGSGAAYDEDNYSCEANLCRYDGCNSDVECQSLGSYVCH